MLRYMNKNYLIILFVIFVAALAFNIYRDNSAIVEERPVVSEDFRNGEFPVSDETWRRVTLDELGNLQFDFRVVPDGYILVERSLVEEDDKDLQKIYVLMLKKDYEELMASTDAREGPPAITMYIFENRQNMFPSQWAQNHQLYTNLNDDTRTTDVVVGGANAIRYMTDGLYQAENVVVAHGGYVYLFSGAYLAEDSLIRNDFKKLVNDVRFVAPRE